MLKLDTKNRFFMQLQPTTLFHELKFPHLVFVHILHANGRRSIPLPPHFPALQLNISEWEANTADVYEYKQQKANNTRAKERNTPLIVLRV